jgi:hypothetical protein
VPTRKFDTPAADRPTTLLTQSVSDGPVTSIFDRHSENSICSAAIVVHRIAAPATSQISPCAGCKFVNAWGVPTAAAAIVIDCFTISRQFDDACSSHKSSVGRMSEMRLRGYVPDLMPSASSNPTGRKLVGPDMSNCRGLNHGTRSERAGRGISHADDQAIGLFHEVCEVHIVRDDRVRRENRE